MKYQIKVMHREMNWQCSANNMFQKLEHIETVHVPSSTLYHSALGHIENCMLRTTVQCQQHVQAVSETGTYNRTIVKQKYNQTNKYFT